MRLLRSLNEVVEAQRADPESREEWDRAAFAREVAIRRQAPAASSELRIGGRW